GDRWRAPLLLQHHVATLGAKGHLHGVGKGVHPPLEAAARILVERNQFGHSPRVLPRRVVYRRPDARDGRPRPRRSRPAGIRGLIETVSGHTIQARVLSPLTDES